MVKKAFFVILIMSIIFTVHCSSSNSSDSEFEFIVRGTVKVDNEPYENALVEFGIRLSTAGTFDSTTRQTDSNGEYEFSRKLNSANLGRSRYRIRAQNPLNQVWSDYREGAISLDKPRIQNFFF